MEKSPSILKVFGMSIGIFIFFLAPFLIDIASAVILIPMRRKAISSEMIVSSPSNISPLAEYLILIGVLLLITFVGFLIWRFFWHRLDKKVPKYYLRISIVVGILTLIFNLIWTGLKSMIGLMAFWSSQTMASNNIVFVLGTVFQYLLHPILAVIMIRFHWKLSKQVQLSQ